MPETSADLMAAPKTLATNDPISDGDAEQVGYAGSR